MKYVVDFTFLFLVACAGSKAADQPPGTSAPGSPASAWTTGGGPASPGTPAMGTVTTSDAGTDSGK